MNPLPHVPYSIRRDRRTNDFDPRVQRYAADRPDVCPGLAAPFQTYGARSQPLAIRSHLSRERLGSLLDPCLCVHDRRVVSPLDSRLDAGISLSRVTGVSHLLWYRWRDSDLFSVAHFSNLQTPRRGVAFRLRRGCCVSNSVCFCVRIKKFR